MIQSMKTKILLIAYGFLVGLQLAAQQNTNSNSLIKDSSLSAIAHWKKEM